MADFSLERVLPYIVAGLCVANVIMFPIVLSNFHTLGTEGQLLKGVLSRFWPFDTCESFLYRYFLGQILILEYNLSKGWSSPVNDTF